MAEQSLLTDISALVEQARGTAATQADLTAARLYWQIGTMINTSILQEKRDIVSELFRRGFHIYSIFIRKEENR